MDRKRRIIRFAAWGLIVSMLLLSSYVGSYMVLWAALNSTYSEYAERLSPLFEPLDVYCYSGLPGSTVLKALVYWSCNFWRGSFTDSWEDAKADSARDPAEGFFK